MLSCLVVLFVCGAVQRGVGCSAGCDGLEQIDALLFGALGEIADVLDAPALQDAVLSRGDVFVGAVDDPVGVHPAEQVVASGQVRGGGSVRAGAQQLSGRPCLGRLEVELLEPAAADRVPEQPDVFVFDDRDRSVVLGAEWQIDLRVAPVVAR